MEVMELIFIAIGIAIIVKFIIQIRKTLKACKHEFDPKEVYDWNIEPKCMKCGKYVSACVKRGYFHRFEYNEKKKVHTITIVKR